MDVVKMKDRLKSLLKELKDPKKKKEFLNEYEEFRERYYEKQQ